MSDLRKKEEGYLAGELVEEEAGEVGDARLGVDEAEGNVGDLAHVFDHVVQNEVRKDHQSVLSHADVAIAEALRDFGRGGVHEVRKAEREVAEGDDNVRAERGVVGALEDRKEQVQVLLAIKLDLGYRLM